MWAGPHPALYLFVRFILDPCSAGLAALGVWALLGRHWISGSILLAGSGIAAFMARGLARQARRAPVSLRPIQPDEPEEETIPDDSYALAHAIVAANVLFCALLMGLAWAEHFSLVRSAVFVILFSIVFPAAAALFCLGGEQMLRARSTHRGWPPWGGAPHRH